MGTTLPWFDGVWEEWVGDVSTVVDGGVGKVGQWMPVVRSGGAFVGIAFAIVSLSYFAQFCDVMWVVRWDWANGYSANCLGRVRCRSRLLSLLLIRSYGT